MVRAVEAHYSLREMSALLDGVADSAEALLLFMGRFFQYAAVFSVGQTALASQVASRRRTLSPQAWALPILPSRTTPAVQHSRN